LPQKERRVTGRDHNRMLGMRYKKHLANLYPPTLLSLSLCLSLSLSLSLSNSTFSSISLSTTLGLHVWFRLTDFWVYLICNTNSIGFT
jgi:hypothetical protein